MAIYTLEKSLIDTAIAIGPADGLKVTLFRLDANSVSGGAAGTIRIYYDQDLSVLYKKGYTYKLVERIETSENTGIANKAEKLRASLLVSMPDDIGFSLSVSDQDIYQWYIKQKEKWHLGTRTILTKPTKGASREIRERYALDTLNDLTEWLKMKHPNSALDTRAVVAQWMFESTWGTSSLAHQYNNLGGVKNPGGKTFRQFNTMDDFYSYYMSAVYDNPRYQAAQGLKGRAYIEVLKKNNYDTTDPDYVNKVMAIYNQIFNK